MADAGHLLIRLLHDGRRVERVVIASTRPQAASLLQGRTSQQAAQMAPLLFSLCGRAQGAAAAAAIAAAEGRDCDVDTRAIACEAAQEHLWRLLLDWPPLLDLPPLQTQLVRWYGRLRSLAAGRDDQASLLADIQREWLGLPATGWLALEETAALEHWWGIADSPAAQLLRRLAAADDGPPCPVPLLPAWTAPEAEAACRDRMDETFAAMPQWRDASAETGALSACTAIVARSDVLQRHPGRLLSRVLARVREVLEILSGADAPRLDSTGDGDGRGLAVVRTARGTLLHEVRVVAGMVEDYRIVAPTEWNFHPRGALAAGLLGADATDEAALSRRAHRLVLSLDPCVGYNMEICRA